MSSFLRTAGSARNSSLPPLDPLRTPSETSEAEPIADFDVAFCGTRAKLSRKDLVLNATPPLPSPSSPEFSEALRAKLEICKAECFWQDPDVDQQAKKVKTATLTELLELVPQTEALTKNDLMRFIETMEIPVFRNIADVSPVFLRSDDMVIFTESAWPHYSLNYQILTAIVAGRPGDVYFSDLKYIKKLVWRFTSPDPVEGAALANLVNVIRKGASSLTPAILLLVLRTCIEYLEGCKPPYVVGPSLIVAHSIFSEDPPTRDNPVNSDLYCRYILPLFGALHYASYQSHIATIVELFVKCSPAVNATPTMKAIIKHFPVTRSAKSIEFLRLLTTVLARVPTADVHANMRSIFLLFANCLTLGHIKVASAACPVWNRIELEPFIMDNARAIYPIVFPIMQQGQREAWSNDIVSFIEEIFRILNRIDSLVFQELCRQKSKQPAPQSPFQESLKNWATIARAASKADRHLNLGEKLVEIQKTFSMGGAGQYKTLYQQELNRQVRAGSLPVTTERPLGIRTDIRPVIRIPVI
jgi:hypothetical protein